MYVFFHDLFSLHCARYSCDRCNKSLNMYKYDYATITFALLFVHFSAGDRKRIAYSSLQNMPYIPVNSAPAPFILSRFANRQHMFNPSKIILIHTYMFECSYRNIEFETIQMYTHSCNRESMSPSAQIGQQKHELRTHQIILSTRQLLLVSPFNGPPGITPMHAPGRSLRNEPCIRKTIISHILIAVADCSHIFAHFFFLLVSWHRFHASV